MNTATLNNLLGTHNQTFLNSLIKKNGPDPEDYKQLTNLVNNLKVDLELGVISKSELEPIISIFKSKTIHESILSHSLNKPYGYSGDFSIIDKIYQKETSRDPEMYKWDLFVHASSATIAVRNRKEYFKAIINKYAEGRSSLKILNIASGPARDMYEFFADYEGLCDVQFDCVEMDEHAIAFAKELNAPYLDKINFINKNIFRFQTEEKYDLIWSAGLFDYFDDPTFSRILNRISTWTKPKAEIIIGNFAKGHSSQAVMEIFADWYLHLRSEKELKQLGINAGIEAKNITINKEAKGVNLFMHMRR